MFFSFENHFDFNININQKFEYYAHTSDVYTKERLEEHLDRSLAYFERLFKAKNLSNVFTLFETMFFKNAPDEVKNLWEQMVIDVVYGHDLGKINPNFQKKQMSNDAFYNASLDNCTHSRFSAQIYFHYYFGKVDEIESDEYYKTMCRILIIHCFLIAKHHSKLKGIDDFINDLEKWISKYEVEIAQFDIEKQFFNDNAKDVFIEYRSVLEQVNFESEKKNLLENAADIFIYARFIYDLILACDYYATSEYHRNKKLDNFGTLTNVNEYIDCFNRLEITKSIRTVKRNQNSKSDINILRSQMFLEAEEVLLENLDKKIFKLNAPTGSGKTHTSINLALKLIQSDSKLNRIFYVFPFNTLIEQTYDTLVKSLGEKLADKIGVINSVTAIKIQDSNFDFEDGEWTYDNLNKEDYENALLSRQFLHYPIVLTTHVRLFNMLFGISRDDIFPLVHLANSVIVLDEIQSYKNNIWDKIIMMIKKYASLLNIRIIIMSATLPNLDILSQNDEPGCDLIINKDYYFQNPLFKNRVELDFTLLGFPDYEIEEKLVDKILLEIKRLRAEKLENKILVEFIQKKQAVNFYKKYKVHFEEQEMIVELITGDDHKAERKRIIKRIKNEDNILLIATQVIEAGVDIDMDVGFKDTSILDAEEQFLGRINRSCKKKGAKAYFFNLTEARKIYKDDLRCIKKELVLNDENKDIQECLINKRFEDYYNRVLNVLKKSSDSASSFGMENFQKSLLSLNFEEIDKKMKLIDDQQERVELFLAREIDLENGKILNGKEVFNQYKDLIQSTDIPYAEKQVRLSKMQEEMDYFIYEARVSFVRKNTLNVNEVFGNIYYFDDGEKYFVDNKVDFKLMENDFFI